MKKSRSLSHLWAAHWAVNSSFSWKKCCFPRLFWRFLETNCPFDHKLNWSSRVHVQMITSPQTKHVRAQPLTHRSPQRGEIICGRGNPNWHFMNCANVSPSSLREGQREHVRLFRPPTYGRRRGLLNLRRRARSRGDDCFHTHSKKVEKKEAEVSPLYDFQPRFRTLPPLRPTPHLQERARCKSLLFNCYLDSQLYFVAVVPLLRLWESKAAGQETCCFLWLTAGL